MSWDISEIRKENLVYTKCFCEENVWKLCDYIQGRSKEVLEEFYVVFISNRAEMVPLWRQRASSREDGFIIWDYHVVLVRRGVRAAVWDFDTTLEFPCPLDLYAKECFRGEERLAEVLRRRLRVVQAAEYLETFASDRTHMMGDDGSWNSPPPPYPPIVSAVSTNNIREFISMDPGSGRGVVMDLQRFLNFFLSDQEHHISNKSPVSIDSIKQVSQF